MRRSPETLPEGVITKDGQVVIYLNREGAEWLMSELPPRDGFVRDLQRAIDELPHIGGSAPSDNPT